MTKKAIHRTSGQEGEFLFTHRGLRGGVLTDLDVYSRPDRNQIRVRYGDRQTQYYWAGIKWVEKLPKDRFSTDDWGLYECYKMALNYLVDPSISPLSIQRQA